MNLINECLWRAYRACERGDYSQAREHLRDAADLALLANDTRTHAATVRATVTLARAIGQRHLQLV